MDREEKGADRQEDEMKRMYWSQRDKDSRESEREREREKAAKHRIVKY